MIKHSCKPKNSPIRFLEVGAGLGALTHQIVKKLRVNDTLDIVELDHQFCTQLSRKFGHQPNITIYEASILDFDQTGYDVVVSSLPLNAFDSPLVYQILLKYKSLVKPGGYISYFEYMGFSKLKKIYLSGEPQVDFRANLMLKRTFVKNYCTEVDMIWQNIPPARIFHCQM